MGSRGLAAIILLGAVIGPAAGQQIYKCSDGKGGTVYQQTQCASEAQTQGVRSFKAEPSPAPAGYAFPSRSPEPVSQYRAPAPQPVTAAGEPVAVNAGPTGYVRCTRPNGSSYVRQGNTCPERREPVPHQAGMVTDVRTGQQQFMVPGGGNGMIDPRTGQRHELISPPPTRAVRDTAQSISPAEACAEARATRDRALSSPNRTINTIRAAEARYSRMCGG